ncbi:hypothetical protein TMatcc_005690 [Talaromyces marneffei ATCC 18224]
MLPSFAAPEPQSVGFVHDTTLNDGSTCIHRQALAQFMYTLNGFTRPSWTNVAATTLAARTWYFRLRIPVCSVNTIRVLFL